METNHKKVPEIRFGEFEDEWEKCNFSDLTTPINNRNKDNCALIPYAITNECGFVPQHEAHDEFGYMRNTDRSVYKIVEKNTFAYNPARINVGSIGYYNDEQDVIVSSLYEVFKTSEDVYGKFLLYWFKSDVFPKWIERLQEGSVRLYFYYDKLRECQIFLPSLEEQKKIANYLEHVDSLITIATDRHEKLLALKKAMLQKLFPQEGERVPRIRFGDFEGAWQRVPLKRIAGKVIERNDHREYTETFTNSAEHGIISQRDYFDHDISNAANINGYYIVAEDDFVYNPRISASAPVGPINRNKLKRKGIMSPLYTVFRPHDVNCAYLEWFFKSRYWHTYMFYNGDNGARYDRFSIKDDVFFDMPIPLPQWEEQQKVGEYFDTLENAIVAQEQKIEKLKQMKSALMQKMFI